MEMINNREELVKAYRDGEMTPERAGLFWTEEERDHLVSRFRECKISKCLCDECNVECCPQKAEKVNLEKEEREEPGDA